MTSGTFEHDGARIHYRSLGDPELPVVVCIHGVTLDQDAFAAQVPALRAAGYRVISWDLRGHGRSRPMVGRFAIDTVARDLAALMDHLDVDRAALLGQSFGGLVAQEFYHQRPERVSGLVLVGSPRLGDRPPWPRRLLERSRPLLLRLWPEGHLRRILPAFMSREPAVQQYVADATTQLAKEALVTTTRAALEGLLRREPDERMEVPVLVVHGDGEQRMVQELIRTWAARDPLVERVVMGEAGHLANQDRPERFNQVLLRFLYRLEAGAGAREPGEPGGGARPGQAGRNRLLRTGGIGLTAALLLCAAPAADSQQMSPRPGDVRRHQVEAFPIMAFFDVYSIQYAYRITERSEFIVGAAYVNVEVSDGADEVIGRMHAPTLPLGIRRYVWRDAHVEYQLWPAYNAYHDRVGRRYHNGFDLYNELRAGYRIDFELAGAPLLVNLQYVFGFGLYPGNKPDNFIEATEDQPTFHVPSIGIGVRF